MICGVETSFKPFLAKRVSGFTLLELIVVIAIVVIVAGMIVPALSKSKDRSRVTVDLDNVKHVLVGTSLFCFDHNDSMPHPTWGSVPEGPDGWAYATQNRGRVAGLPKLMPSGEGRTSNSNQIPFFKLGQLAAYVGNNQRIFDCPMDLAEQISTRKFEWRARTMKLTSYTFNGAVSGYGAIEAPNAAIGSTYKISGFNPIDFLLWEADETNPFNFQDGASNPGNSSESASLRHAGGRPNDPSMAISGDALVGTVGGTAYFTKWTRFGRLRISGGPRRPNELYCGPGYR